MYRQKSTLGWRPNPTYRQVFVPLVCNRWECWSTHGCRIVWRLEKAFCWCRGIQIESPWVSFLWTWARKEKTIQSTSVWGQVKHATFTYNYSAVNNRWYLWNVPQQRSCINGWNMFPTMWLWTGFSESLYLLEPSGLSRPATSAIITVQLQIHTITNT